MGMEWQKYEDLVTVLKTADLILMTPLQKFKKLGVF